MNELTKEWVEKAEGDFNTALREYRAQKAPNYDAARFIPLIKSWFAKPITAANVR